MHDVEPGVEGLGQGQQSVRRQKGVEVQRHIKLFGSYPELSLRVPVPLLRSTPMNTILNPSPPFCVIRDLSGAAAALSDKT